MGIIRFAIYNPVKVSVGVLLVLLFGFLALFRIPVQLTPNVDQPVITVETAWRGRSPQEVEREILEEQEDVLKGVTGLREMTATAERGQGTVELEFFVGTAMNRALQEVSNKLDEVPEYPDEAEEPVITAASTSEENAIAWIVLDSADPSFNIQSLENRAEERIKPVLERVQGVGEINIFGGRERQARVEVDPKALAQRDIPFGRLADALRGENVNVSAGELAEGHKDVRVRTVSRYESIPQVRRTIVAYRDGGPVRVGDVARVREGLEKKRGFVRVSTDEAMAIQVIRETGANVISTMAGLRSAIEKVNREILPQIAPDGVRLHLEQVYDQTIYIHDAIELVRANLVAGGLLAVCVLLLFLRVVRPTVVVALAIPVSVVGAFVVMAALGRNINVISLAGLAFAVGMVVDSAIVVLENIDRHLSMGKTPARAALDATGEVWGAILASALTTVAVFVPVLTVEQEVGQLFRDIAIAICAAVLLALVVAVTVIPTASARFLRARGEPAAGSLRARAQGLFGLTALLGRGAERFADGIHALTARSPGALAARLLTVAALTVAAIGGAWLLMPPASYLPSGNRNLVFGVMMNPPGYNIEQATSVAKRVEDTVEPYLRAESREAAGGLPPVVNPMSGKKITNLPAVRHMFLVTFRGTMFMGAVSADKAVVEPLSGLLTTAMMRVPGSFGFAQQASIFGRGIGGSNAIDVNVSAEELGELRAAARALEGRLVGRFGKRAVRPQPQNYDLPGPELQARIDRVRASDIGLSADRIGLAIQGLVDGAVVGDYRMGGESVDLLIGRHPSVPLGPRTLGSVPIAAPRGGGRPVPLETVVDLERADAPQQIRRIEQLRTVTLTVTPQGPIALERAMGEVRAMADELRGRGVIGEDVLVDLAGTADKLSQVKEVLLGSWHGLTLDSVASLLGSRMFLALLVTFLLMAALFESYLYPLVILFSVPLATAGGFLGLAVVHAYAPEQQLDTLTMLGFVILIGIVVNNAILIVHQALNFMRGVETETPMEARDAIRASVRVRIRPIFMTATTSVLGMLPLVASGKLAGLVPGLDPSGSELYRGIGSVVVGGLIVATIFTLVLVPLVFSIALDLKRRITGHDVVPPNG